MNKIKSLLLLTIAVISLSMVSCNDKSDEPQLERYTYFATLESIGNGTCSFSVQENSDSQPVILTATATLNSSFKVGDRYVIQYSNLENNPFVSGPVTLYYIIGVFSGDAVIETMENISPLIADPINVLYAERTGKWLNIEAWVSVAEQPAKFGLFVDESTLGDEYPDVYLGFRTDNPGYSSPKTLYASFDIQSLFDLPNSKGFTLHYRFNNAIQTKKFEKP